MGPRALRGDRAETQGRGRGAQRVGRRMLKFGMRNVEFGMVALVVALAVLAPRALEQPPLWDTGTFSILGFDPATGEVGGAVQSRVFSVGNGVLWAEAGVGVAATQAIVDVSYGPQAL